MPAFYEHPIQFLKGISKKLSEGWVLIEFDYLKESLIVKKEDEIQKALLCGGRIEWETMVGPEAERIRGTDKFFIV